MAKTMHGFKPLATYAVFAVLLACVRGSEHLNASASVRSLDDVSPKHYASCISAELYSQVKESITRWQENKLMLSVISTLAATILIFWQRAWKFCYKNQSMVEDNVKIRREGSARPHDAYLQVESDAISDASTSAGPTTSSDLEADVALVDQLSPPPLPRGGARLLGFAVLWACVAMTVGGFGPAYIVWGKGNPWVFDAIRQIGPNQFQVTITVHAAAGAVWVLIVAHQLVTAWAGVRSRGSATFGQSHRVVGYFGMVCVGACALTGFYVTTGSEVSRLADTHPVIIDGVFIVLNFAAAIVAVLQGNVHAHKQGMTWVIIWTAWPGALRLSGYAHAFLHGVTGPAESSCQRLLHSNVQAYCDAMSFVSSSAGIGGSAPAYAYIICAVASLITTAAGIRSGSVASIDWGILLGNAVGLFAISVGHELLLPTPYEVDERFLWACLGCEQPHWLGCEASCESDRSLCS